MSTIPASFPPNDEPVVPGESTGRCDNPVVECCWEVRLLDCDPTDESLVECKNLDKSEHDFVSQSLSEEGGRGKQWKGGTKTAKKEGRKGRRRGGWLADLLKLSSRRIVVLLASFQGRPIDWSCRPG